MYKKKYLENFQSQQFEITKKKINGTVHITNQFSFIFNVCIRFSKNLTNSLPFNNERSNF